MAAKTYWAHNGPMQTTAAPAKVATGTAIKTLMQLKTPAAGNGTIRPIAWGISFDASAAAVPGVCELIETDVAATITAFVAADLQKYGDPNAGASQAQIGSTTASGYTASAEGTITAVRTADLQLVAPTNQYAYTWPLGREFECGAAKFLRVRVTFPVTVNALCFVIWEE